MAEKKQQKQPIPIRAQEQTQSVQAGSPKKKEVFDPEKSRALRHQSSDATTQQRTDKKEEPEERLRLAGESEPPASIIGGVGGRPMSRRETKLEAIPDEMTDTPIEGRMMGMNRSPKVIQKNRKRRAA